MDERKMVISSTVSTTWHGGRCPSRQTNLCDKGDQVMKSINWLARLLVAVCVISVAGCGSSGGSGSSAAPAGVSGTSKGVITALGSIFVNGVEYNVTGSSVTVDKSSGLESDLKVGRVVTVKGAKSDDLHGSAVSVEYKDNLEGPVDITPAAGSSQFQAFGQTIAVNTTAATVAAGKTVFSNFTSLSQLSAGSLVEVSGLPDANGVIQASFIELKNGSLAASSIELKGAISGLNATAKTFMVGALTVDYSAASLNDLPAGGIANGLFVEVSGSGANYTLGAAPIFKAAKVESNSENPSAAEGEDVSIEGFINGFSAGSNTFTVNGQAVNAGTLSLAGIANNMRVEVEGKLSGGVLMVTKIKLS